LQQFKSLKDYTTSLENSGKDFPLKVMGERTPKQYFSITMLADIYERTQNPNSTIPASAPFGQIQKRGTSIDPNLVYSAITPPPSGSLNLFQGDVISFEFMSRIEPVLARSHSHSCIISHSCDISNSPVIMLAPVFSDSELTSNVMKFLSGRSFSDPQSEKTTKENWLRNEKARFIAFPQSSSSQASLDERYLIPLEKARFIAFPQSSSSQASLNERYLIPLDLLIPVRRDDIISCTPIQRFSYRGLSFLQWRLSTLFLRDVQNSDETRDL
jgi:hypothetical protein